MFVNKTKFIYVAHQTHIRYSCYCFFKFIVSICDFTLSLSYGLYIRLILKFECLVVSVGVWKKKLKCLYETTRNSNIFNDKFHSLRKYLLFAYIINLNILQPTINTLAQWLQHPRYPFVWLPNAIIKQLTMANAHSCATAHGCISVHSSVPMYSFMLWHSFGW